MRLFLFPIAKGRSLIYCPRIKDQLASKKTYIEKFADRASAKWEQWENTEQGWQKKITKLGNQAFARIPYEEWGLKTIPPLSARGQGKVLDDAEDVEVLYARKITSSQNVLDQLLQLATERQALHRKWMWASLIGMPITAPVALIPILPNIPFFYLLFRAWSHWRALSGSKHLEFLVKNGLLKPTHSQNLEEIYALCLLTNRLAQMVAIRKETEALMKDGTGSAEDFQKLERRARETFHAGRTLDKDISESTPSPDLEERWSKGCRHDDLRKSSSSLYSTLDETVKIYTHQLENRRRSFQGEIDKSKKSSRQAPDHQESIELKFPPPSNHETRSRDWEVDVVRSNTFIAPGAGRLLATIFGMPQVEIEIERAISQVQNALESSLRAEREETAQKVPAKESTESHGIREESSKKEKVESTLTATKAIVAGKDSHPKV